MPYSAPIGVIIFGATLSFVACAQNDQTITEIPVFYDEYRFLAQPVTEEGDTLTLFIDSGSPSYTLYDNAAQTLGLNQETIDFEGIETTRTTFPVFKKGTSIPPALRKNFGEVMHIPISPYEPLYVIQGDTTSPDVKAGWSGMLGSLWLAGRVWTFDYGEGRLFLREDDSLPEHLPSDTTELEFNREQQGEYHHEMTRVRAEIDGEELLLFFDTGATMYVLGEVLSQLGDERSSIRESSFIRQSIIDRWHANHPHWRFFEKGANGGLADLIEVPRMRIAGHTIGPVWFISGGGDRVWDREGFFGDGKTDGTLGGSALKHFKQVTVDYIRGIAVFKL